MTARAEPSWLRHVLLYAAPAVFSKGLHLLLLPVYVSLLSLEDFGRLELLIVSLVCLQSVLDLGWGHALLRLQHAEVCDRDLVHTVFCLRLALHALVLLLVAGLGAAELGRWITHDPDLGTCVWYLAALFCLRDVIRFSELRLRAQQRSGTYAALQMGHAAAQLIGVGSFLVYAGQGVPGILLGQTLAASLIAGVALSLERGWLLHACLRGRFDRGLARRALAFGLPIAPALCVAWVISGSDRYMLSWLLGEGGLGEVAQYGFAARVGSALTLVVSGFTLFFSPEVFRTHRDAAAPARMARLLRFYVLALFALSSLLIGAAPVLVRGWFREFEGALVFLPLLLAGWMIHYVGGEFSIGLEIRERTGRRTLAGILAVCVNLAANLALIPLWGGVGACIGTLLGYTTLVAIQLPAAQRLYPVPCPWALWVAVVVWVASAALPIALAPDLAWLHTTLGLAALGAWAWNTRSPASVPPLTGVEARRSG